MNDERKIGQRLPLRKGRDSGSRKATEEAVNGLTTFESLHLVLRAQVLISLYSLIHAHTFTLLHTLDFTIKF